MKQTQYVMDEAMLILPGSVAHDGTIHMVKLTNPDAALVVSRGQMGEGDELGHAVDQQMEKMGKHVRELRCSPKEPTKVGVKGNADGFEIKSEFIRGNERVYQYQVAFVIPNTRTMMAFSYAKSTPFSDDDLGRWAAIKKSVQFRQGERETK